jgi:hypothetical protein
MKVADLIELLQMENPEAEVHFSYNYGDHWRTQVAPRVDSVETGYVTFSDYHRMPKVYEPDYDEDDETDADQLTQVVILG